MGIFLFLCLYLLLLAVCSSLLNTTVCYKCLTGETVTIKTSTFSHVCLLCFCLMLVWMSYSFKNCCYTTNLILAVPGAAFVPLLLTYHSLEATIKHDFTINKKWTIYFLLFINLSAYCPKSSGWFYFPTTCVPCLPRALVKYISVILSLSSYFLMPSLSLTLRWFKAI